MHSLLLSLVLAQAAPAPGSRGARDLATIPPPGASAPLRDLGAIPDAELAQRIAQLRAENKRAFSDRRALLLDKLLEEQERRRHEREWEADEQKRRGETEAAIARQEAAFQAAEEQRREALAAERRMVAAAKAQATRDAELAAEERAIEQRQARTRWLGLGAAGAVALAALGYVLARARRAG